MCDCLCAMQPGYLREQLPNEAPQQGETWEAIMEDVNKCIVPGVCFLICLPLHSCLLNHIPLIFTACEPSAHHMHCDELYRHALQQSP